MGYVKNQESGNNKSVLTFGVKGHHNHVHIGYPGDKIQQPSTSTGTTTGETTTTTTQPATVTKGRSSREFVKTVGSSLLNAIGIQESFKPGSFGRNAKLMNGKVIIPRNLNQKIKSPVSGEIVDVLSNTACMNQIVIEFEREWLPRLKEGKKSGDKQNTNFTLGNKPNMSKKLSTKTKALGSFKSEGLKNIFNSL